MGSKVLTAYIFLTSYWLIFPSSVYAQVVINEVSPASDPEWVELYNTSDQQINLEGWEVTDNDSGSGLFAITITQALQNPNIPAKGHLVVYGGAGKTRLSNSSESVYLYDNQSEDPKDSVSYSTTIKSNESYARSPDGTSNWVITNSSVNAANQSPTSTPASTPTVTLTPTQSPTSTSTPKPTNTPKPNPTSTPSPTPTKLVTSSPTPSKSEESPDPEKNENQEVGQELVLGDTAQNSPTITPTPEPENKRKVIPTVLTITGLLVIASALGFLGYKHYKPSVKITK